MKALTFIFLFLAFTVKGQVINLRTNDVYTTIQAGINEAVSPDTILVADGIYYEQINFLGKAITVGSNYILDGNPEHIDNTILDGYLLPLGNSSVVLFLSGEDTTSIINGFTIRNGKGTFDTTLIGPYLKGGGINIENSGAKIMNNKIMHNVLDGTQHNLCSLGAGICAIYPSTEDWVVVLNNTFDSNQCISNYYDCGGAGIYCCYNLRLENNVFSNNSSVSTGPGFSYGVISAVSYPSLGTWFIAKNNTIQYNRSEAVSGTRGAGIFCYQSNVSIIGNLISFNESTATGYANVQGSGICLDNTESAIIKGNNISNNTSSGSAGGISYMCAAGGNIIIEKNTFKWNHSLRGSAVNSNRDVILKENIFEGNISTDLGGAVHLSGNSIGLSVVENNTFIGNQSERGGAFSGSNTNVLLSNNVFHQNSATSLNGGAIYLFKFGDPLTNTRIVNNSFSENTAVQLGGAIYSWSCNPIILNSVFWENSASSADEIMANLGNASVAYSNIDPSGIDGEVNLLDGNMFHDPLFCSTYCLMPDSTSPCLNVGTEQYVFPGEDTLNAPLFDILGKMRPINDAYDMGAYEVDTVYVATSKLETKLQFQLYPNPFNNRIYCRYTLEKQSNIEISIYDILGRKQSVWQGTQVAGSYNMPIEPDNLQKGVYLLQLKVNGMSVSKKIIKQ